VTNLFNMVSRMPNPAATKPRSGSIHPTVIPALGTLVLGNVPVFVPGAPPVNGSASASVARLRLHPGPSVLHQPPLRGLLQPQGDVQLHDLSFYRTITKAGGVQMAQSLHLYFDADAVALRATYRVDGSPKIATPSAPPRARPRCRPSSSCRPADQRLTARRARPLRLRLLPPFPSFQENVPMFTLNQKIGEALAVLATIDPISQGAGTVTTGWVDQSVFEYCMAVVQTGVMGASATLDAKLQQATDSSGTGVKDITGKAITQIVKASGDNKQAFINMKEADLDTEGGFRYIRLSMTVGTAASLIAATLYGGVARYQPATAYNQAGVVQNVG
jgi:hypothetical protein